MDCSMPRAFAAFVIDNSLLLVLGAAIGLVWANVALPSYEHFTHAVHFVVNDVGMVFFFALAAKEVVEATLPGGALASPRRAALPLLAAVGGMVGPASIHAGLSLALGYPDLARGWAIPCATDIAFSALVARIVFGRHPAIPFLLLLAIADDALGLLILAVFYPSGELRLLEFVVIVGAAVVIAWRMSRRRVMNFWPYVLVAGSISWVGFLRGGLHPALALVPIIPFFPHETVDLGIMDERELHRKDPLNRFAAWWHVPVQLILFAFGLVNAGVPLSAVGPGTWIVLTALTFGKPVGIVLAAAVGVMFGLQRPA
jgi:Na+:H+ antiporter, NhaA family